MVKYRNYGNYAIVLLLICIFIAVIISSYILWFVIPRGVGEHGGYHCLQLGLGQAGNYLRIFQLPRYMWVDIHSWLSVAAIFIVFLHMATNWRWIVETAIKVKDYFATRQKAILERYITNFVLFIMTAFQVLSGCVIWLVLPRGMLDYNNMVSGIGRTFWGLQRNEWLDIHAWVAILMLAIIIIHVIQHWRWIVNMTLGKSQPREVRKSGRQG